MNFTKEDLARIASQDGYEVIGSATAVKPSTQPDPQPQAETTFSTRAANQRSAEYKATLINQCQLLDLPAPVEEHQFHSQRKWRLDLAWPDKMVAIEIEGGIWLKTKTGRSKGHAHPKRFIQDIEKYNEAVLAGWRLLRTTPKMIKDGTAVSWLERVLR